MKINIFSKTKRCENFVLLLRLEPLILGICSHWWWINGRWDRSGWSSDWT